MVYENTTQNLIDIKIKLKISLTSNTTYKENFSLKKVDINQ